MVMKLGAGRLRGLQLLCVCLVLLLGGYLRLTAVSGTVVDHPFRNDVTAYYQTAYNLNAFGTYSSVVNLKGDQLLPPVPDAFVTPGYPLFLTLFIDSPPNDAVFLRVALWQAVMAIVMLGLIMAIVARVANPWCALLAGLFTAMSPHLVNTPVFMLSETLFGLLLLLLVLVFSEHLKEPRWTLPLILATGLLVGLAALVRPVLEFFPLLLLPLLWLGRPRRDAARLSGVLLLGFALAWVPWIARNYATLGRSGDPSVLVSTFLFGTYPDMEYNHDPALPLSPSRQDPNFARDSASLGAALAALERRLQDHPGQELEWYLVGKPLMLWSWGSVEMGPDAHVYHVLRSPYSYSAVFRFTRDYMYQMHWPLVLLAFICALMVWIPPLASLLEPGPLLLARFMSLLLLYNTAVLMVLAPFMRYSIPFLPIEYGMAATGLLLLYRYAARRARAQ